MPNYVVYNFRFKTLFFTFIFAALLFLCMQNLGARMQLSLVHTVYWVKSKSAFYSF